MKTRIIVDHVSDNGNYPYRVQVQRSFLLLFRWWDTVSVNENLSDAEVFMKKMVNHRKVIEQQVQDLTQVNTRVPTVYQSYRCRAKAIFQQKKFHVLQRVIIE